MDKKYRQSLLSAILIGIGILLAFTASSFKPLADGGFYNASTPSPTLTPTVVTRAISQPGSTDWITLMGVIIVLIVVIPVLFRRSTSTKQ